MQSPASEPFERLEDEMPALDPDDKVASTHGGSCVTEACAAGLVAILALVLNVSAALLIFHAGARLRFKVLFHVDVPGFRKNNQLCAFRTRIYARTWAKV